MSDFLEQAMALLDEQALEVNHSMPEMPPHEDGEHVLWQTAEFTSRDTGLTDNGRPIREAIDPYWRYYCTCGSIGGRKLTQAAASAAFSAHVRREKEAGQ